MATATRLRALFVKLTAASSSITALACSSIGPEDFESSACGDVLEGVTPAEQVDYLELRRGDDRYSAPASEPPFTVLARRGAACSGASDRDKCLASLQALQPTDLQSPKAIDHFDGRYLVYTRGDAVGAVTSIQALQTFLAPFENAKDGALLLSEYTEHAIPCDGNNVRRVAGGFEFRTETGHTCGEDAHHDHHIVLVSTGGRESVRETDRIENGDPNCAVGRRPEGYTCESAGSGFDRSPSSIGEYLAVAAELEAASVPAFRRLARELRAHAAPEELVARAVRAARDEVRHARITKRLAVRFGGVPRTPRVGKLPVRPLVDIAIENAREGCVRETFGALLATVQSSRATDSEVKRAMTRIAHDETEHAALAWDVAAWLDTKIDAAARDRVRRASEVERDALASTIKQPWFTSPVLGLPSSREASALFETLSCVLAA